MRSPPSPGAVKAAAGPSEFNVSLKSFLTTVGTGNRGGSAFASVAASFLLVVLLADCLLLLDQSSPLERPMIQALLRSGDSVAIAPVLLLIQILLLILGIWALRRSALDSRIGSGILSVLTFGADGANRSWTRLVTAWAIAALAAGGLYWLCSGIAPLPDGVARSGVMLDMVLLKGLPFVGGWVIAALLLQALADRAILVGVALALVALAVLSVAGGGKPAAPFTLHPAAAFQPSQVAWFRLLELSFVWTVFLAFAFAIIANPFNIKVFKLTGESIRDAELCVDFSPFGIQDRAPKFLMFQLGRAQILAMTRRYQDDSYELLSTSDDHLRVPIHDRSIKLWNVSGLMASLPQAVEIKDSAGLFALKFVPGRLSTASSSSAGRKKIGRGAVDLATEVIFKNDDLRGLLLRAARDALDQHTSSFRPIVVNTTALLAAAPSPMTLGLTGMQVSSHDELQVWLSKCQMFIERGAIYLEKLTAEQIGFEQWMQAISNWRIALDSTGKQATPAADPSKSLEDHWFMKIIEQFGRHERDHADVASGVSFDFDEAVFLLRIIGLRFNDVEIQAIGQAAACQVQLLKARSTLEAQLKEYEAFYRDALTRRTAFNQGLVQTIIGVPGVITSRSAPELMRMALGNAMSSVPGLDPTAARVAPAPSVAEPRPAAPKTPANDGAGDSDANPV